LAIYGERRRRGKKKKYNGQKCKVVERVQREREERRRENV
jgi:hypothetical protein